MYSSLFIFAIMETKAQSEVTETKQFVPRIRKDGKPLFAEKIDRANAAFAKAGIPKFPKEK